MNTYNFLFLISLLITCSYTLRTSKTNAKAEEDLKAQTEEDLEAPRRGANRMRPIRGKRTASYAKKCKK